MNQTRRAALKRGETLGRPTRDRVHPEVVPDPTRRRRTTATRRRQIMSPVTRSRAGSLRPSECEPTCGCLNPQDRVVDKSFWTPHAFELAPRTSFQVQSSSLTHMLLVLMVASSSQVHV